MIRTIIVIIFVAFLTACVGMGGIDSGVRITKAQIDALEPGKTTLDEIKELFDTKNCHKILFFFFLDFCPKIKFKKCSYIGAFLKNFRNLQIEEIFWDFLKILKMFTNRSIFENFDIFLNERIWFIKNHILFQGTLVNKKTCVNPK